jgi:hypothetical protein
MRHQEERVAANQRGERRDFSELAQRGSGFVRRRANYGLAGRLGHWTW